jgi:hypothetical protein
VILTTPKHRNVQSHGHKFNADLKCQWCGVDWEAHQLKPRACEGVEVITWPGRERNTPETELSRLCKLHNVSRRAIKDLACYTEDTVYRAMSLATRDKMAAETVRIIEGAARELLRAKGVEVAA